MNLLRLLLISSILILTACDHDVEPTLDINGEWLVKHGLDEEKCQIKALFTDESVTLTFLSLEDGACQPERFGIPGDSLPIQIDKRIDLFDDEGALAATLELSIPTHSATGTMTFTETEQGISAVMDKASDPNGYLDILLNAAFPLVRNSK